MLNGANFAANCVTTVEIGVQRTIIYTTVNIDNGGIVTGGGAYAEGTTVQLVATPSKGYSFVKWSDGVTTPTRTIIVGSSNATYNAIFEKNQTALTWAFGLEEGGYQPTEDSITVNTTAYTPTLARINEFIGNNKVTAIKIYVTVPGTFTILKSNKLIKSGEVWALLNVSKLKEVEITETGWKTIVLDEAIDYGTSQVFVATQNGTGGSYAKFDITDKNGVRQLSYIGAFTVFNDVYSNKEEQAFTLGIDFGYEA